MIDALLAWRSVGPPETLLVLGAALVLPVGLLLGRWPRIDTLWSALGAASLAGLGGFTAHQRLAALPWQLSRLPERQLVGRIAQSEAQATAVLGGALLLASAVGACWAWRRSTPSDGPVPILPTATATLGVGIAWLGASAPGPLPSPGDLFGLLIVASTTLVLGSALRPSHRWQGPALASLVGTALVAHGALLRALVIDPDVAAALPRLLWTRDVAMALAVVGVALSLPALRHLGAAVPLLALALALGPAATQLPSQWARRPSASPWATGLPHPEVEPTRLAGGCLVGPDGTRVDHGLTSDEHELWGCSNGGVHTVAAGEELLLTELVALAPGGGDVGILTSLGASPNRLRPWFNTRWALPLWRITPEGPSPRPVRGSLLVTQLDPVQMVGPHGPTDLQRALGSPGRAELLVLPTAGTLGQLHRMCTEALRLRPQGTRCGLALGDPMAWEAWATQPMPSTEGW